VHDLLFLAVLLNLTLCYLVRTAFDYNRGMHKSRRQVASGRPDHFSHQTAKCRGAHCFVMLMRNAGVVQALNPFARALRIANATSLALSAR